jgi:nucleoside-diphosphate-sugar epimerase
MSEGRMSEREGLRAAVGDRTEGVDAASDATCSDPEGPLRHDATSGKRHVGPGFAGARILIVGCGDVGRRLVRLLSTRFRVLATARTRESANALRALGVVPIAADLDRPATLWRLGGIAPVVVHLAPPPDRGVTDPRTRALLGALHGVERLVYASTSGVYGDRGGAWTDETATVAPITDRARRRVDAEAQLRGWSLARGTRLSIVRVPGIYADDRLPTARLAAGTPALVAEDDVYTNHVHAEDLARVIALALFRGAPQRIYHAVDDSTLKMGDWFDRVADAHGLARPPRMARDAIGDRVSPALLSFLSESRRLTNGRMKQELGVRLAYPTVDTLLGSRKTHGT